jgi:hypothetical protein
MRILFGLFGGAILLATTGCSGQQSFEKTMQFAATCPNPPPTAAQMQAMTASQLYGALQLSEVASDKVVKASGPVTDPCVVAWALNEEIIRDAAVEKARLETAERLLR